VQLVQDAKKMCARRVQPHKFGSNSRRTMMSVSPEDAAKEINEINKKFTLITLAEIESPLR